MSDVAVKTAKVSKAKVKKAMARLLAISTQKKDLEAEAKKLKEVVGSYFDQTGEKRVENFEIVITANAPRLAVTDDKLKLKPTVEEFAAKLPVDYIVKGVNMLKLEEDQKVNRISRLLNRFGLKITRSRSIRVKHA